MFEAGGTFVVCTHDREEGRLRARGEEVGVPGGGGKDLSASRDRRAATTKKVNISFETTLHFPALQLAFSSDDSRQTLV